MTFNYNDDKMTFAQAMEIVETAIKNKRRYAFEADPETVAAAVMASHNYAVVHSSIVLAQTRKLEKGDHGQHSTLGALIMPRNFFLSWLHSGKALDVLGIADNGCLQVRRINFTKLDIGTQDAKRPESLLWLPTEYHTYDEIPKAESDCKGQRARAWEQVVTALLKTYYKSIGRNVDVDWVGGLNNVQFDVRVLDKDTGELEEMEVKGYFGRIAKFLKDKKAKKSRV